MTGRGVLAAALLSAPGYQPFAAAVFTLSISPWTGRGTLRYGSAPAHPGKQNSRRGSGGFYLLVYSAEIM